MMMDEFKGKVLIIGEDTRSFLSSIRALGQNGYEIHVVCFDRNSVAVKSKYIKTIKFYNFQSYNMEEWVISVLSLIEKYNIDVVIPCDERAMIPLKNVESKLKNKVKLAIGNEPGLALFNNKWETKKLARLCNVPITDGEMIESRNIDYNDLCKRYGSPFVAKPLESFNENSLYKRYDVAIIDNPCTFDEFNKKHKEYMVERYFQGIGEGVSVFSVNGIVQNVFCHQRDSEGVSGGSSYRHSISIDSDKLACVSRMCKKIKYTGVAMFEFRTNHNNEFVLIEVNSRLWGSLPLSLYCEIDIPSNYVNYLLFNTCKKDIKEYPVGRYARSLTSDLYSIKREFEKTGSNFINIRKIFQYTRILVGKEKIDTFDFSDIKPFLFEVSDVINMLTSRLAKKINFTRLIRCKISRFKLKSLFRQSIHRDVIFVCYGNIMRSPFAENVMKSIIGDNNERISIKSYGLHKDEDRSSPDLARLAAKELSYNIDSHRSRCLRQSDIKPADIVFYFDEKNKYELERSYDIDNMFCLGDFVDFSGKQCHDIHDPYGKEVSEIKGCYQDIVNSLKFITKENKDDLYVR